MHDLGLDEFLAALVGECDPVMAVGDEVGAAYLEDRYCWVVAIGEGGFEFAHPCLGIAALRMKVAVEFRRPIHRSDDLVQRDAADTYVPVPADPEPVGDLGQR